MINGIVARLDFQQGVAIFKKAFPTVPNVIDQFQLTQGDLQLEQPIVTTSNVYNFPVLINQQSANVTPFNTEIRLNVQDTFLPQYVSMFIIPASSSTDTTWRPLTYPNPIALPTSSTQLNTLYNGVLKIAINNRNYTTQWKTSRHLMVPQTQQTAALGAGSPGDQFDGGDYSFYPMQPYVIMSGSSNIQISVTLPAPPTTVDANSRLALCFRGLIAYNSTVTT